eukprot:GHVQ01022498.1.p1 GENE.GHVQ01022498.1~~GHVQ01022498.1.p1  ORF type:complete len:453 (+),score=79.25 GHVQ01022498.1:47-1405(+)
MCHYPYILFCCVCVYTLPDCVCVCGCLCVCVVTYIFCSYSPIYRLLFDNMTPMASQNLKLVCEKGELNSTRVSVCGELSGVEIKVDCDCKDSASSPLGRLPTLLTPDGPIYGSESIGRYICRMRPDRFVYGATFYESAQVDQWVSFCNCELEVPLKCMTEGKVAAHSTKHVRSCLSVIDKHLLTRTFLAAERPSMADVWIALSLDESRNRSDVVCKCIETYPNIARWLETCLGMKQFKKYLTAATGAQQRGAKEVEKKEKKEKKEEKEETEEADDGEAEKAAAKKVPNPLDSLPPSSMVLDEWKRCYSNTKDLYGVAMKWFWEHFDVKGYSLWYMRYDKLEDECKVSFLCSNQLGGFFQRVDPAFRKYSFGVIDVVEEKTSGDSKPGFDIQGVWLVRGQELPKEITEHVQYESHKFTKLDHTKTEDHKIIQDYWCADDIVEGRKIADSKVWK